MPSNKQWWVLEQGPRRHSLKKCFQCHLRLKWYAKSKIQSRLLKKIGKSGLKMQVVLQVFSNPPEILPARSLRLDNKKQNVNVFMKKVIPRSVSLIWSSKK